MTRTDYPEAITSAIVAAADSAGIGFTVTIGDPASGEYRYLHVNDTAARIIGRSPEEVLELSPLALIAPEELLQIQKIREKQAREGLKPLSFETAILRPDGARVPIEAAFCAIPMGECRMTVTFVTDLSERERAREALRRSEGEFQRLIENAPEAIWIADRREIVFANRAAARLFGFDEPAQALGKDPREFAHPEDLTMLERRARAMLRAGERLPPFEYRARRSDGSYITIEVSSIPIEYDGRQAVLTFGRDVTERKQFDARVLQADRLATLGMLAGGMAHAINNPLTYVLLNLDQLTRMLPKFGREAQSRVEAVRLIEEAHGRAGRVADLVRRMRSFARSDDRTGPASMCDALEAAIAIIGNEIRHRGRLVTELSPTPPVVASPAQLEQALLNLLLHAAQSIPEAESNAEVRIALRREGARVIVDVCHPSNGSPEACGRTRRVRDLGLAICRDIVAGLGGGLEVLSSAGAATTHRVWLPAAEWAHLPAPASAHSVPASSGGRARVLVVDDDPGVGRALSLTLDEHAVEYVTSVSAALAQLLGENTYDIVFCDLVMPELGGIDLYHSLGEQRVGLQRKIVFMTAGGVAADVERRLMQIPNPRVEKPFDVSLLRTLVERALRERRTDIG